jgi:uncharacterized protein (TIGR03083 family)
MNVTLPASAPPRLRRRHLDRDVAMRLAATEYDRLTALLGDLTAQEWAQRTDCDAWDVRAMAGHVVGMTRMAGNLRESLRQDLEAARRGGDRLEALTALQVDEHAHLSTTELVRLLAATAPSTARGRRRMPWLVRQLPLPGLQSVGGAQERWTIGYLNDVILTRDPWMHRMDICRATDREPLLTADHDAVLVADVVREWAERHDQNFRLELTGPAGGTFGRGEDSDAVPLSMDAVHFCRVLSGRSAPHPEHELLEVEVPF